MTAVPKQRSEAICNHRLHHRRAGSLGDPSTGPRTPTLPHPLLQPLPSSPTPPPPRTFHPRALLLRQGSARLTCAIRVSLSDLDTFLVGTVEGFLTLWTATAGRCVKSSLVLPFPPSTLLPYQREVTVRIGRVREGGPWSEVPSHSHHPTLIRRRCLRPIPLRLHRTTPSPARSQSAQTPIRGGRHGHRQPAGQKDHCRGGVGGVTRPPLSKRTGGPQQRRKSTASSSAFTTPVKAAPTSVRAVLHCLTIGGTLHRWDLLDLTAQEGGAGTGGGGGEDENVRELLVTKSKASVIKLPFPSLALPSGSPPNPLRLPPTPLPPLHPPASSPPPTHLYLILLLLPPPSSPLLPRCLRPLHLRQPRPHRPPPSFLRLLHAQPLAGGAAHPPLLPPPPLPPPPPPWPAATSCPPSSSPPSSPSASSSTPPTATPSSSPSPPPPPTKGGKDGRRSSSTPWPPSCPPPSHPSHRPSTLTLDGDRLVAGTPAGEVFEWVIPPHLLTPLTSSTFTSPFTDALTFHSTPSFPSSPHHLPRRYARR